jgi:hypothetical protein
VNEITVHKADATRDESVADAAIHIDKVMPPYLDPTEGRDLFASDAEQIAEVLFAHLPGGTQDELIAALLRRRASLFRVRFPEVRD